MTAAEQILAAIAKSEKLGLSLYEIGYADGLHKNISSIIEAEDAKRAEAIHAMVETLAKIADGIGVCRVCGKDADSKSNCVSCDNSNACTWEESDASARACDALNLARVSGLVKGPKP